jgi:putative transposase
MTTPRRILPETTVMITRRTLLRTFLLRPEPAVRQIYLYALAVLAKRYGISVHVPVLMSTHEHLMVTDHLGQLPNFLRDLHRTVAKCIKRLHGWEGALWDDERTSVVELQTPTAVIGEAAYMIANPVKAGLVRWSRDWPGVTVSPQRLGRTEWTIRRPKLYFDRSNRMWPDEATIALTIPSGVECSDDEFRIKVAEQVSVEEAKAHSDMHARKLSFLGADRVQRCSIHQRAKSSVPVAAHKPVFAVGKRQRHALQRALATLRAFRRAYREALHDWRAGLRDVVFPAGTWLMRTTHGVAVQDAPG